MMMLYLTLHWLNILKLKARRRITDGYWHEKKTILGHNFKKKWPVFFFVFLFRVYSILRELRLRFWKIDLCIHWPKKYNFFNVRKKEDFFYHMEKNIEKMSRRVQQAAAYIKEKHIHKERKKKVCAIWLWENVSTMYFWLGFNL